ncbi:MAG: tetratricopeptide repeat protein [Planctomycetota bacterium]
MPRRPLVRSVRTRQFAINAVLAVLFGCSSTDTTGSVYAPPTESERDPQRAHALTEEAATWITKDPEEAERLLREALTADLYHGPAHNNLGVLHLQHDKLYEAAHEFEWARKLLPGHPDPRLNLALVLERAGRPSEALDSYNAALEIAPEHVPTMQGLARLLVRTGREDPRLEGLFETIALRGENESWRQWARQQMSRR